MSSLNAGNRDVAQSAKYLRLKHEDLGLDPQHHVKKSHEWWCKSVIPVLGVGTGKSYNSLVS